MYQIGNVWVEQPSPSVENILKAGSEYHEGMTEFATSLCNQTRRAVDVGACYGLMALQMAERFDTVEAFEPFSSTHACLVRNTQDTPSIRNHAKALSDKCGSTNIFYRSNDGRTSLVKPSLPQALDAGRTLRKEVVEAATLDSYGFADVDLIKVDVEGHEEFVLKGALKTITTSYPVLIVEQKRGHRSTAYCKRALSLLGYNLVRLFRDKDAVYVHRQSSNRD